MSNSAWPNTTIQGEPGEGVPTGGTTGQVLRKASNTDYDSEYHTPVKADVGLSNVDNTSDATKNSAAATLTNKTIIATTNVVEEITTTTDSAAPAPTGGSLRNFYTLTALAQSATFAAPSGTPANGNYLTIRIKASGTQTIAWNAIYRAIGVTLPLSAPSGKTIYVGARYNEVESKWDVLAVSTEA